MSTRNDIDGLAERLISRGYLHSCSRSASTPTERGSGGMGWNNRMGWDGMTGDDAAKSRRPDLACMCRLISIRHHYMSEVLDSLLPDEEGNLVP